MKTSFFPASVVDALTHPFSRPVRGVTETFDTDAGAWRGNSILTAVTHDPSGALQTACGGGTANCMGAVNLDADHSGSFARGVWTIRFDVNYRYGAFTSAELRFRHRAPSGSGWHHVVDTAPGAAMGWRSYAVSFDTTWDDRTAIEHGWVREAGAPRFADLWRDVWSTEVRINAATPAAALIDNFRSLPPTPGSGAANGAGGFLSRLGRNPGRAAA